MRGDFSRVTFTDKHYTSVRLQQGRVVLDSDWNEQAELHERSERLRFEDVVGPHGAPQGSGFALHSRDDGTLAVSAGRFYAGGFVCALAAPAPLSELLGKRLLPSPGRTDLVYVDAWQRDVTALGDSGLLEPALGGVDTSTRLQTVWTLRVLSDVGRVSCPDSASLLPGGDAGTMSSAAPGGYLGLESRLYRIEIHDGGTAGSATFKWSRDNGSVAFAVEEFVSAGTVRVEIAWPRGDRPLEPGDWVEVTGDASELAGCPGTLARVDDVRDAGAVVELDRSVSSHRAEGHPSVRRWDQRSGPAVPVGTEPIELEAGIEVRFSEGSFRPGDYWTVPARPGTPASGWTEPAPPEGLGHRLVPLALVTWEGSVPTVRDCRRPFRPLTDVEAELVGLRREVAELRSLLEART